jgi:hypothetical protein
LLFEFAPNGGAAEVLCLLRRVKSEHFCARQAQTLGRIARIVVGRKSFWQKDAETGLPYRTVAAEKSRSSRAPALAVLPLILEGHSVKTKWGKHGIRKSW